MTRWRVCAAYAGGGLSWTDGMALEDFFDATDFLSCGGMIPPAKWVDELRFAAAAASLGGFV